MLEIKEEYGGKFLAALVELCIFPSTSLASDGNFDKMVQWVGRFLLSFRCNGWAISFSPSGVMGGLFPSLL